MRPPLPALITSLAEGRGPTDESLAVLQAFQTEIAALRTNTGLDPVALDQAAELDAAITDSLAAYKAAGIITDPSTLTALPTQF